MNAKYKLVIRPSSPVAVMYKEMVYAELPGGCAVLLCDSLEPGLFGFVKARIWELHRPKDRPTHTVQIHPSEILLISDDPESGQSPIGFLPAQ